MQVLVALALKIPEVSRAKFGLPEERVQFFLDNPEEAMPLNGDGAAFLNGYIESNLK